MKKIVGMVLILSIIISSFGICLAQPNASEFNVKSEFQFQDTNGIMQKINIVSIGDNTNIEQYDESGNLVETCTITKGSRIIKVDNKLNGKSEFTVKVDNKRNDKIESTVENNNSQEMAINSMVISSTSPTLGYTYLGRKAFVSSAFPVTKYLSTSVYVTQNGTTTYSLSSYNGTLASFISSLAIGLIVPAFVATELAAAIISAGLGVLVGNVLSISTSIPLSCIQYTHEFTSRDGDRPLNYNEGHWVGHQYIINDINHPSLNGRSYKDTYITEDYYNNNSPLHNSLFFAVYGVNGSPL